MLTKNQLIPLTIHDISSDGSGVGRADGMAVFVPGSAVGDELQVRIAKVRESYAFGIIEEILVPSPDRIESACPVAGRCGGCSFQHLRYEAELRAKQNWVASHLKRIGSLSLEPSPIIPSPQVLGYRNKAQYPVRRAPDGGITVGFYAPRSHRVVGCSHCVLQPPIFGEIVDCIREFCEQYNIPPYDEEAHRGVLRHIYLRMGTRTGQVMVCLVCNADAFPHVQQLCRTLTSHFDVIRSIVLNVNKQRTNVTLGPRCITLVGTDYIEDELCGVPMQVHPQAFYQVNHDGAERLFAVAAEFAGLTGNETVVDLYCGAGVIGLSMAAKAGGLIGVEVVAPAVDAAKQNAARAGVENATFLCADAAQAAAKFEEEGLQPDVVLLDPPRKGCDEAVIQAVCRMGPQRVVYVSCNSATLARDLAIFAAAGYAARKVQPLDMFPRTANVECVALLTRSASSQAAEA